MLSKAGGSLNASAHLFGLPYTVGVWSACRFQIILYKPAVLTTCCSFYTCRWLSIRSHPSYLQILDLYEFKCTCDPSQFPAMCKLNVRNLYVGYTPPSRWLTKVTVQTLTVPLRTAVRFSSKPFVTSLQLLCEVLFPHSRSFINKLIFQKATLMKFQNLWLRFLLSPLSAKPFTPQQK